MPIDDPAKILELQGQPPSERFDPKLLAVQFCGALLSTVVPGWSAGLNLLGFVQGYYSSKQTEERLRLLNEAVQIRVEELAQGSAEMFAKLHERLESNSDRNRAIARAILETAISGDEEVVTNVGRVIATQAVDEPTTWSQVNTMIADLVRLNADDLRSLQILFSQQADIVADLTTGTHEFHQRHRAVMNAAIVEGFSPEQFFGHCGRLFGFGLAIHINQNPSFERPDELCFGMTTRGLTLGKLLGFKQARMA
jgi:hypothetical protein